MKAWKRIEPTDVAAINHRTIVTKTFILPDGRTEKYGTFSKEVQHNAAVIALTPENKVIIARQFRPGPEIVMEELPGGGVDPDEDFAVAAGRELCEETGYVASSLKELGAVHRDAYNNATWHYFLATGCERTGRQALEENEFVEVVLISIGQLLENARSGRMTDGEAIMLAYENLKELQKNDKDS